MMRLQPCTAIHVRNLSKTIASRTVLRGIDFALRSGECLVITGSNGSGKTTLLNCVAGAMRPSSGSVEWQCEGSEWKPTRSDSDMRRQFGYVPHDPPLYPDLSINENLLFAARMYGVHQPRTQIDKIVDMTGIAELLNRRPHELSRGLRQRCAIARMLVHDPAILILDEPETGLDIDSLVWLNGLLGSLIQRRAMVLLATHRLAFWNHLGTSFRELIAGQLETFRDARSLMPDEACQVA